MTNVTVQEALKAAIEAMENEDELKPIPFGIRCIRAINKCKSALAEIEKYEPFGYFKAEPFGWTDCAETDEGAIALYELPQPIEKCEPVGYLCESPDKVARIFVDKPLAIHSHTNTPLYTSPQPRDWGGLSDDDIVNIGMQNFTDIRFAKAIEAKLKQLNTKG